MDPAPSRWLGLEVHHREWFVAKTRRTFSSYQLLRSLRAIDMRTRYEQSALKQAGAIESEEALKETQKVKFSPQPAGQAQPEHLKQRRRKKLTDRPCLADEHPQHQHDQKMIAPRGATLGITLGGWTL